MTKLASGQDTDAVQSSAYSHSVPKVDFNYNISSISFIFQAAANKLS
jgi:hypothetical protein